MAITKKDVLDYVMKTPENTNRIILDNLVTELMNSDNLDTSDATAAATDILAPKTAYVNGKKVTGVVAVEATSATPKKDQQVLTPEANKYYSKVTVAGDTNLVAENIKQDVTIFGVTGSYAGLNTSDANATAADIRTGKTAYVNGQKLTGSYAAVDSSDATATAADIVSGKTAYVNNAKVSGTHVDLNTSDATATAANIDEGKTAYVKGSKITGTSTKVDTTDADATAANIDNGKTAYVKGVKIVGTSTKVDTTDANAVATDILSGKTAYVNGVKVTGSIASKGAQTYTPGAEAQTINANQFLSGAQTIAGDSNLIAENIKSGVTIFGVTGTYTGEGA